MYFDRFDIVCAWYLYLSEYHEGMYSEKYRRLCRILDGRIKFNPGPLFGYETLSENAREIYDNLCATH